MAETKITRDHAEVKLAADERLACLYSDGSLSVAGPGRTIEELRDQALYEDEHENDPAHFTKIVRLRSEVVEVIEVPSAAATAGKGLCPTCGRPHATLAQGEAARG